MEIRQEMNGLNDEVAGTELEVQMMAENLKNSIPVPKPVSDHLQSRKGEIYKWFSSRPNGNSRRCLSKQKNVEMIRNQSFESVMRCGSLIGKITTALLDKAALLKGLVNRQVVASFNLTMPCIALSKKDDCLGQAREQVKQRRESVEAALKRFGIFKRLKEREAEINCEMCRSITDLYRQAQEDEESSLKECIKEDEKYENTTPQPDQE
ncbi:uncharacterized protein LOC106671939 isoform X2 [Cimex lectularius]|nr:uncharacterized protein LOC106671939 isoform X2 [Cimex lectularius]